MHAVQRTEPQTCKAALRWKAQKNVPNGTCCTACLQLQQVSVEL